MTPWTIAIIITQMVSLACIVFALGGLFWLARRGFFDWCYIVLPGLLFANLALFLIQRLMFRFGLWPNGFAIDVINNWAISVQAHLAISAAVAVYTFVASVRRNGKAADNGT